MQMSNVSGDISRVLELIYLADSLGARIKTQFKAMRGASSLGNESGAVLIMALVLMIVMAAMIPAALHYTQEDFDRSSNFTESTELFYLAEAGLEHAKTLTVTTTMNGVLAGPDGDITTTADNGTFGVGALFTAPDGNVYDQIAFNGTNYYIRGYDNDDGDGDLSVDADGIMFVQSHGLNSDFSVNRSLTAMTELFNLPPSTFPAAVTLVGPASTITSTGSGFVVAGAKSPGYTSGYAIDGTEDTNCPGVNGIATESPGPGQFVANTSMCTAPSCLVMSGGASTKIKGVDGGSPDVGYDKTSFTAQDAEDLHTMMTAPGVPDSTVTTDFNWPATGTIGSAANPVNLYFQGDLNITGNITGYGVLIVDGDLDISGTLTWNGIILIGSCSTCNGALVGTGAATVNGAMVVGNSVDAAVNFTGSANINYSCEGIDIANGTFDFTFQTVAWNQTD